MNSATQTILALTAVAAALAYLGWSAWRKHQRATTGCGGDCGCHEKIKIPPHLAKRG